eukprot:2926253-Amphidinium_carterae.8
MTCMFLLNTTIRSHFGTSEGMLLATKTDRKVMEHDNEIYELKESTVHYSAPVDGDTEEDIQRLLTLQHVQDDRKSVHDLGGAQKGSGKKGSPIESGIS